MPKPMIQIAMALLEKKLATLPQAELEAMAQDLRSSEKGSTEVGRAMLERLERCLERDPE